MTEKEKFQTYLAKRGFTISGVYCSLSLSPHHYKDDKGNHYLVSRLCCCMFEGINTPRGGLGCITFYYGGRLRKKYHKYSVDNAEILKVAKVYKKASQAIKALEQWEIDTFNTIRKWEIVL